METIEPGAPPAAGRRIPFPEGDAARILLLVGLALVARLLYLTVGFVLVDDELHYAESLSHFLRGEILGGLSDYWSFFYPLAALPFAALTGDAEIGLRMLSTLAGAAVVLPVYRIARRLWGRPAALLAGLFIAVHPMLLAFSAQAMTESLFSFLVLLALDRFLRALERPTRWGLAIPGAVLGLAWLTRQEAQFLLLLLAVIRLVAPGSGSARRPPAIRLRSVAVMAAVFVVVASPYLLLLRAKTGLWTTGAKASVNISSPLLWTGGAEKEEYLYRLNAEGTGRALDEVKAQSPFRVLWENRRSVAARYPENLSAGLALMPTLLSSPFLLLLVPLGLLGRRWERDRRAEELTLLLLGAYPFALFSFFRIDHRFLVSYLPVYLLWAGAGGWQFRSWWSESISARTRPAAAILALVVLSLVPYAAHKYVAARATQPREHRTIGRWIREHQGGVRLLAWSGCSISYYAGTPEATYLPWTNPAGLLRFARHHRYTHLAVRERDLRQSRPALAGLLEDPAAAGFEEIRDFPLPEGDRIVLYRIGLTP